MSVPVDINPDDFPGDPFPPPGQLPGLGRFLRRRYSCNVAVTEQMAAIDLLHDVIFVGSRHHLAQSASGKLALKSKRPVPYAYGTEQFNAAETALDVDSVADWIGATGGSVIIAPHTSSSEVHTVASATYPTSQNSITLSSTGGIFTIVGFSGCDGASTPATATITVSGLGSPPVTCSITLEAITFSFTTTSGDTKQSIASYIAGTIASHPALFRRFTVVWNDGDDHLTLTAKFGTLTLADGLAYTTSIPVVDPTTQPTLAGSSGGSFAAGDYYVAYSDVNAAGETLLSPYKKITLTLNQKIDVSALSLATNATSRNWYVSPEANSLKLRYHSNTNGSAFSITTLPKLTATLPPDLNRTGTEIMAVSAVFADRADTRSSTTRSNVILASFSWLLGTRNDTVNRVDLKYRDSSDDWRLIDLRLRDDASIAKIKAVKNKEFNGQAIDNTDQAYRIASGLLAEYQDADFFYRWTATRTALLLQEGDVVAITDDGSGVYDLPVRIEQITFEVGGGMPQAQFTARKYSSRMYDDSVVKATIPIVSEAAV